jgi:DNA polymerase-3 subunit delta'
MKPADPRASSDLAPWLGSQLTGLRGIQAHALLLSGPSGLGQYELALALARSWLCHAPTDQGACGQCASCHAIDVRTHADLCVLLPETLSLALDWPLDEKTQSELDSKKRKPSKEIKVEAVRELVGFTQLTGSGSAAKVVLVYPAERLNAIAANALLKTLEEPVGQTRFVLATQAADQLLPTIRSRCQTHAMAWPAFEDALGWLVEQSAGGPADEREHLRVLLHAAGGRPADVLQGLQGTDARQAAERWRALPKAVVRGDVAALANWSASQVIDALQKLCHDVWLQRVGAEPRFFPVQDLPPGGAGQGSAQRRLYALGQWSRDLATSARHAEHPYSPGLMLEALVSRAQQALRAS